MEEIQRLLESSYSELQIDFNHLVDHLNKHDYKQAVLRCGDLNTILVGSLRDVQEAIIKAKLVELPADTHLEKAELIIERYSSNAMELADKWMKPHMEIVGRGEELLIDQFNLLWIRLELCDPSYDITANRR